MSKEKTAAIIGVGPENGLGAALAKRFASEGLHVFLVGRTEERLQALAKIITEAGGKATPLVADATKEQDLISVFEKTNSGNYQLELVTHTVDSNLQAPLLETSVDMYEDLWRKNSLSGFLVSREALKQMQKHNSGTVIITGATASLRAKPPFTAFAAAKSGLRALTLGAAREFGPQGIHVVHAVIDGVINGDRARNQFPEYVKQKGDEGLIQLEDIAEVYWSLHCQPKSAWSSEIDIRPFKENF